MIFLNILPVTHQITCTCKFWSKFLPTLSHVIIHTSTLEKNQSNMSAQFIFLDHTVQWATVHWFFRAVSRMKKGMSQDSSNEKLGPSSFFRVANPVTAWPSFLYPPSQVSCKQQYIIQQETFQDTLNLWLNYKNSLITVRFHLW